MGLSLTLTLENSIVIDTPEGEIVIYLLETRWERATVTLVAPAMYNIFRRERRRGSLPSLQGRQPGQKLASRSRPRRDNQA